METTLIVFGLALLVIGAMICAWLHKLGIKFILKKQIDEIPSFKTRFIIQIGACILIYIIYYAIYFNFSTLGPPSTVAITITNILVWAPPAGIIIFSFAGYIPFYLAQAMATSKMLGYSFIDSLRSLIIVYIVCSLPLIVVSFAMLKGMNASG